jgi:hypothetical protein
MCMGSSKSAGSVTGEEAREESDDGVKRCECVRSVVGVGDGRGGGREDDATGAAAAAYVGTDDGGTAAAAADVALVPLASTTTVAPFFGLPLPLGGMTSGGGADATCEVVESSRVESRWAVQFHGAQRRYSADATSTVHNAGGAPRRCDTDHRT